VARHLGDVSGVLQCLRAKRRHPWRSQQAVLVVVVPRFLIAGIAEITSNQVVSQAGAVLGFLLAEARRATHDSLAIQLRDIERQAGVRRTLRDHRA
jgi:hypothetical protein